LGTDTSMLKGKKCYWFHSSKYTPKRDKCQLVDKSECQSSLYRTNLAAKECWVGNWKPATKERTSWAEATSAWIQVIHWS